VTVRLLQLERYGGICFRTAAATVACVAGDFGVICGSVYTIVGNRTGVRIGITAKHRGIVGGPEGFYQSAIGGVNFDAGSANRGHDAGSISCKRNI